MLNGVKVFYYDTRNQEVIGMILHISRLEVITWSTGFFVE